MTDVLAEEIGVPKIVDRNADSKRSSTHCGFEKRAHTPRG